MRFESHIPEKRGRGSSGCQVRKNIGVGVGGGTRGDIFQTGPLKRNNEDNSERGNERTAWKYLKTEAG